MVLLNILLGIIIPLIGTSLGSGMVFLLKNEINNKMEKLLLGFAGGVMIAASIWSLILPSIEISIKDNIIAWLPSSIGFIIGVVFLLILDYYLPNIYSDEDKNGNKLPNNLIMILAIVIHNIPEGMAVGVIFAGVIYGNSLVTLAGAFSLSIGIAIQNFPEGAIVSMPLRSGGMSKIKSFIYGILSGVVEPIAAVITIFLTGFINVILPYLLAFAAGAMIYVVVEELIPEMQNKGDSKIGVIGITIGFVLMMILDVALG